MGNSILYNTAGSIALAIDYVLQGPYSDKFATRQAAKTLRINSEFYVRVDDTVFCIEDDVDLDESDLDTGSNFDASDTYYVYACHPLDGTQAPVFKISQNATYPAGGWDANNSRKSAGFDTDGSANINESTLWDLRTVALDGMASDSHASTHKKDGTDEIDGDQIDIDFTPDNYDPDTSPAEASDVDHLAAHLSGIDIRLGQQIQNTLNLAAEGSEYWFDESNDQIDFGNHADFDLGSDPFSIIVAACPNVSTARMMLISKRSAGPTYWQFAIETTGIIFFGWNDGTGNNVIGSGVWDDGKHHVFGVAKTGNDFTFYVDGKVDGTDSDPMGDCSNSDSLKIGVSHITSYPFGGSINRTLMFNLNLSADEMKEYASGMPVPYKYQGASNTIINSGNFTIDKAYRIVAHTDGDFTTVGAADNNVGTEFVATGTGAGILDAGDTVRRIGCLVQLEQPGIGHNQWLDNSGNEHHGTASGALPINLPVNHQEKYVDLTVTGNTSYTTPQGYKVLSVIAHNKTANALTGGLDSGLSVNGTELISGMPIGANATVNCTLVASGTIGGTFATADDTIYFSDGDDDGDWNGVELEVQVQMQKIAIN